MSRICLSVIYLWNLIKGKVIYDSKNRIIKVMSSDICAWLLNALIFEWYRIGSFVNYGAIKGIELFRHFNFIASRKRGNKNAWGVNKLFIAHQTLVHAISAKVWWNKSGNLFKFGIILFNFGITWEILKRACSLLFISNNLFNNTSSCTPQV